MATKTEILKVKFITNNINGKDYLPGNYKVSGKDLEALAAAPYVTKVSKVELQEIKKAKEIETAARVANGFYGENETENIDIEDDDEIETGSNDSETVEDIAINEVTQFTVAELSELSEQDLFALYEAEQAKIGKTAPKNILRATIIDKLTK